MMTSRLLNTRLSAPVLALVAACALPAYGAETKPAITPAAASVSVAPALRSQVVEAVVVTGTLTPRQEILVGPEIEGLRIIEVLADEGDKIAAGQVLVRLARETLDAQLAQSDAALSRADAAIAQVQSQINQAQANVTFTGQDLQRSESLLGRGASTQAMVDQKTSLALAAQAQLQSARDALLAAQADKKNSQAQRAELMVRIARSQVRSPAAGIVSRRTAKLGAVASGVGEPLFRIIADGEIELDAEVPEQRLLELKVNQAAILTLADGTQLGGKIRLLSPEIDRVTRLGRVRISIDANDKARIGSFARASIELRRSMSITVPSSAIIYTSGKATLQTVSGGAVVSKPVDIGLITGGRAEILNGVTEGETIVVRAGPFLRDGDAVSPVPVKEPR